MNVSSPIKNQLKLIRKSLFPRQYWKDRYELLLKADHELELQLVPYCCDPLKVSVDIGAAGGVFSAKMCQFSREVYAFEPRPRQSAELSELFSALGLPVRVEAVALSETSGVAQMRMLLDDLGRSTIEAENLLEDDDGSARSHVTVTVRKLDEYNLSNVAFIKVDVEGHEVSALRGAKETILRSRPIVLVESEDRHRGNSVSDVRNLMEEIGYSGFFILGGELLPIECFDVSVHQDSRNIGGWKSGWARHGVYVNNFFYVPSGLEEKLSEAFERSGISNASS